jgi:hypothetical protein
MFSRVGYEPTSTLVTLGSRVFGEKKLWLLDNRSYTKSVSAGPTSFLPDLSTTEISESM